MNGSKESRIVAEVISTRIDPVRSVVRLTFVGDIGAAEASRDEAEIMAALGAARQGFFLLTDLSKLESMDIHCMTLLTRTMDFARRCGVAQVVRIIPDSSKDIGLKIMSRFHYPVGLPIITCENEAEAARALT